MQRFGPFLRQVARTGNPSTEIRKECLPVEESNPQYMTAFLRVDFRVGKNGE